MLADEFLSKYLMIFTVISFAVILSLLVIVLPRFLANFKPQKSKLSSYECGFEPFEDSHKKFDVKFYVVAILFIIFDLEIAFLIPWAHRFKHIGALSFWSMMFFIFILIIGFVYEWKKGALELD
jgi:NADH-quinone oxidoreductase subunit A